MLSLVSSKKQDLILNIGSGSVYGAVVEFAPDAKPHIFYTNESLFPVRANVDAEALATHMLAAVHTVVSELSKHHKKRIHTVHVVFASPWFSSFSKSLSITKPDPFLVSEKTIEKMVSEKLDAVTNSGANPNPASGVVMIERALPNIRLNGYETKNPFGKTAKTVDVSVYSSTIPAEMRKKIEAEIYAVIHPGTTSFHTFPFAAWNIIRALFAPKEDFVFIDIGHEVTDMLLVKKGTISLIASFPLGKNQLVRKAALFFETKPELASSMVNLYSRDAAEPEVTEKIKTLISAFGEEWSLAFSRALKESKENQENFIPQLAFFASNTSMVKIFSDIISKQIPNITPLTQESLSQFVGFDPARSMNACMILETLYLNK